MGDHKHKFTKLAVATIKRVHKNYQGTPGDKAFLTEQCEGCPKMRPRDYGNTNDMKVKLKELQIT